MCRKLIYLTTSVLVLGVVLTGTAKADLVGWWRLDEGSGTTAVDSSGNGNDGALQGLPQWVDGKFSKALQLDGVDDFVEVPHDPTLTVDNEVTIMAWINAERHTYPGENWQGIMAKGGGAQRSYSLYTEVGQGLHFSTAGVGTASTLDVPLNEWVHVCAQVIGGSHQYYINGEDAGTGGSGITLPGASDTETVLLGDARDGNREFLGMVDDFRIYNHALSQDDVRAAMLSEGQPLATGPVPADGAIYPDIWVSLGWKAGDFVVSHNVYMGENFDDVNEGTGDTFIGNVPENYLTDPYLIVGFQGFPFPDGLVPGSTYYWRVDEVNDANVDSPWKGDVWSFSVPPKKAYDPIPGDGAKFVDPAVVLSWTPGYLAGLHTVYFGDDFDTVNNATGGTGLPFTTYTPVALEPDKTYYWRVDEWDQAMTYKGDVWSFKTLPDIPMSDPNLMGWWKFDEGSGATALDWSGHGNHGAFRGDPQRVVGYDGDGLEFDGDGDYVEVPHDASLTVDTEVTVMAWIHAQRHSSAAGNWQGILAKSNNPRSYSFYTFVEGSLHFSTTSGGAYVGSTSAGQVPLNEWVHVAAMVAEGQHLYYINGEPAGTGGGGITLPGAADTATVRIGMTQEGGNNFLGMIDDVRIYDKALTQDELEEAMRGDPRLAWNPSPGNGSTPDVGEAVPLTWSPGENVAQHDVYFGLDKDAVENADASDTTGIYRGRQGATSYNPPESVEWGSGPYYWRIDEYNADATINKGRVWSFRVADFILVDDIEDYDTNNAIWENWVDGLGYVTTQGVTHPGNGTGSEVGDPGTGSYTEEDIVHSGGQSMPFWYNNNKSGKMKYSEAKLTLSAPRDWTEEDVKALSLWFQGFPASVGSFAEAPAGTYTMTGSGADIWDIGPAGDYHDEFHFAYKMLNGQGTIVARVESVENTDGWAKAGVMIRETLEGGSPHAFACVTPENGVAFQGRPSSGAASFNTAQAGVTAPHWVRLERDLAGNFTVSHSTNGSAWEPVTNAVPENIQMAANVYVGLALTSHNAALTCQAVLSNVTITGNVSGQWMSRDIGIQSNDPEPMYVAIANSTGAPAVVYHDDADAAQADTWTEWNIDLKEFQDKGVNLADVNSVAIGFGNRNNPQAGGAGKMYFDDFRLYRSGCVPDEVTLSQADLNSDCVVDFRDLEIMVGDWLAGDPGLAADLNADDTVDFKDYAVLADQWLEEQIWPE
jgi:hypothetical protein